jgi:hypothetical protein
MQQMNKNYQHQHSTPPSTSSQPIQVKQTISRQQLQHRPIKKEPSTGSNAKATASGSFNTADDKYGASSSSADIIVLPISGSAELADYLLNESYLNQSSIDSPSHNSNLVSFNYFSSQYYSLLGFHLFLLKRTQLVNLAQAALYFHKVTYLAK